jgi:hypothetical protein
VPQSSLFSAQQSARARLSQREPTEKLSGCWIW